MNRPASIYILDDEPSICRAYARLIRSANMIPKTYPSIKEFLKSDISNENACVISDIRMPGTSGLDLPALLSRNGYSLPVIFITTHDTQETRTVAQRAGASAYFRKPVDAQALLDAIAWALSQDTPIPQAV